MALEKKLLPTDTKQAMISEGATLTELKYIFGMTFSDIKTKTDGMIPAGKRGTHNIYLIRDVARKIMTPDLSDHAELIVQIAKLSPDKLPPKLRKATYDALIAQQTYEQRAGDLWNTDKVVEIAGDAFKALRLSLLLFPDTLEREAQLNEKQRQIVQRLTDEILRDMREKLIHVFKDRRVDPVSEPEPSEEDDGEDDL